MGISIETPTGSRINVEADSALIGRDRSCQIALPDENALQPIHAKIRKVANRWMVEAQGAWQIQVGTGIPGRMSWLQPGDVIHLTESGPEVIFDEPRPALAPMVKAQKPVAVAKPQPVIAPLKAAVAQQAPAVPVMVEEWFYASAGEKCGPFSSDQLKQLAEAGVLLPEDMVWKTGMAKWVSARSVTALFPVGHRSTPKITPAFPGSATPPLVATTLPPRPTSLPPGLPVPLKRIVASNPPKTPF